MYVIQILPRGVEYKIIWFLVISTRHTWDEDYQYKNDNDNAYEITRNVFLLLNC